MTTLSPGKARRDRGCTLAASKRPVKTLGLQLLILERAGQGTPFTVDHVIDPGTTGNRSNHTGAAFLALSQRRLIRFTGQIEQSKRDKRHAGTNRIWLAVDAALCQAEAQRLRQELTELLSPPRQGELFDEQGGSQ